jgi:hypothetical protein
MLTVEAGWTLLEVRVLLAVVPYERWKHRLRRSVSQEGCVPPSSRQVISDVVWAVDRISQRAPKQLMCLARALAVCQMLERRGIFGNLEIGVRRDERGGFSAHAWVEFEGTVIIGNLPDLTNYSKLDNWPNYHGG